MKKLALALMALSLIGCTTVKTYDSPPQSYRAPMTEKSVNITGNIKQTRKDGAISTEFTSELFVYFDNQLQINGILNKGVNGDIIGKDYNGKQTNASCSSRIVTATWAETRCMIFIENERIATLTM